MWAGGSRSYPQRRVGDEQAVLDGVVEADDERHERVVDRLGGNLSRLDLLGQVGDEGADVFDG